MFDDIHKIPKPIHAYSIIFNIHGYYVRYDFFDLLKALEGLCYKGRAREVDDSTYLVLEG